MSISKKEIYLLAFSVIMIVLAAGTAILFSVSFMKLFFGSSILYLFLAVVYYWVDSRGYWNNLGRIRRTFYLLFLILISVGFMTESISYLNWQQVITFVAMAVFADLAIFQTPHILSIWNTVFVQENEVRDALKESRQTILMNAKKAEKFSEVIQNTDIHFDEMPFPVSGKEYEQQMEEYICLYSGVFGFAITIFLFPVLESKKEKELHIDKTLKNISIRHAHQMTEDDREQLAVELSEGQIQVLQEDRLIAIPYFGNYYSIIVTVEAKDVAVDPIDASHVSSLLYIFDWYMEGID
ncbi:type II toxin-antitoxin system SpoIISA family toxin [Bacillus gobiensis]|uniref:type II toxin-antitoxin system SpoIISA family toxin n=1 Tax=Bacillus gobiensis TaxID=1441095 RepID=UPI003D230D17